MKKYLIGGALALLALMAVPAAAQQAVLPYDVVVSNCNVVKYTAGLPTPNYIDTTGKACSPSSNTFSTSQLPAALGQQAIGASLSVTQASDYLPTAGSITARDVGSSTASGQNSASIITGTPTAASYVSWALNAFSGARLQVSGTWTGTGETDISNDGAATWYPTTCHVQGTSYRGSTFTANGMFLCDIGAGATNFRVRSTAVMTGTMTVQATFSPTVDSVKINNPISIFDNSSGAQATVKAASTPPASTDTGVAVGIIPYGVTPVVAGSAASSAVIKASAGNLLSAYWTAGSTQGWGMIFNAVSLPSNGATTAGTAASNLQECIYVPANSTQSISYTDASPEAFSTGITMAFSSTSCASLTASATATLHGSAR